MIYKKFIKNYVSSVLLRETYQTLPDYEFIKKHYETYGEKAYIRFVGAKPTSIKTLFRNLKNKFHRDPSGIYAFPASYVLRNYQNRDSNIFFSMRNIIALVDRSQNKLILSHRKTLGEWMKIFQQADLDIEERIRDIWRLIKTYKKPVGEGIKDFVEEASIAFKATSWAKYDVEISPHVIFIASQIESVDLDGNVRLYSGERQRYHWLKAGFDALEDLGDSIIHPNEPHQIIFLKEDACEIVDTFDKSESLGEPSEAFEKDLIKKMLYSGAFPSGKRSTVKKVVKTNSFVQKHLERSLSKFFSFIFQRVLNDVIIQRIKIKVDEVEYTPDEEFIFLFSASMKGKNYTISIVNGKSKSFFMTEISGTLQISKTNKPKNILYQQDFVMNENHSFDDVIAEIQRNFKL